MPEITFQAAILKEITALAEKLMKLNPDNKSNTGRLLGEAYAWDQIATYAEKQAKLKMASLIADEILDDPKKQVEGDCVLGESPKFTVTCKVSAPRKTFDLAKFGAALKKKYKIPEAITNDFYEKSKSDGSSNRTVKIIERS